MSRKFSQMLFVLLFSVSAISITIAEENKKISSLEEAKTVDAVEKWHQDSVTRLRTLEPLKIHLKAGEKILEIAKTDAEKKKGYQYKFGALSDLAKAGEGESRKELDKLTKELEADENFRSIIYDDQFQKFINQSF
ncbi:MAG: hypothetical protein LBG58_12530, partial [Planctomycetaceae bacterium]|nr:hypothetical protein [Planctomycetaceae bacterium]